MTRGLGRARVQHLVERFSANLDYYRSAEFDEESTKQLFVTPLFEALGWDVTDQAGRGPAREVILETRLQGETPDEVPRCPDPNVLIVREVLDWPDADGVRALAYAIGANLEDAFGVRQRRFLASVEPDQGEFDVSRYR